MIGRGIWPKETGCFLTPVAQTPALITVLCGMVSVLSFSVGLLHIPTASFASHSLQPHPPPSPAPTLCSANLPAHHLPSIPAWGKHYSKWNILCRTLGRSVITLLIHVSYRFSVQYSFFQKCLDVYKREIIDSEIAYLFSFLNFAFRTLGCYLVK